MTTSASGATVTLGSTATTAGGALYRLCWCGGGQSCLEADSFKLDFGYVHVKGPLTSSQDRTCVSGQTCAFGGIMGNALAAGDSVLVLETCGTDRTIHGMLTSAVATIVSASGAAVNFGSEVLTGPGGQYRLCWCADGFACSIGEHFKVDVGELRVIGVAHLEQHRTCVAGQTCSIDGIEGQDLSSGDKLMVLDTCSGNNVIYRFPEASSAVGLTEGGASADWGTTFISASGGEYRQRP